MAVRIHDDERSLPPALLARPVSGLDSLLAQSGVRSIEVGYGQLDVEARLACPQQPEPPVSDPEQSELAWSLTLENETRQPRIEVARPLDIRHVKGQTFE